MLDCDLKDEINYFLPQVARGHDVYHNVREANLKGRINLKGRFILVCGFGSVGHGWLAPLQGAWMNLSIMAEGMCEGLGSPPHSSQETEEEARDKIYPSEAPHPRGPTAPVRFLITQGPV